jgi:hypothetical protein
MAGFSNPTPQFGTAEYIGTPGNDLCHLCHQPISADYYRVNNAMACAACAEKIHSELAKDTRAAYMRALAYGAGAAIAGLILYATFAIVTGIMIGYISLAVGWMVGKAMMKGSGGVGGRRYQIAAVLLTYAAVSMAAIPVWIHFAGQHKQQQSERQTLEEEQRQLEAESGRPHTPQPEPQPARPHIAFGSWLVRLVLLGLASPFLEFWGRGPSLSWLIGLVILFVGMRFAWRITEGLPLAISGPYHSGS